MRLNLPGWRRVCAGQGGRTGLIQAAKSGHLEAVRLLLEHAADPNAAEEVPPPPYPPITHTSKFLCLGPQGGFSKGER